MIEQNDPKTSGAVILEGAVVRGDVEIGEGSSVWFNAVIRAEGEAVRIGRNTNIQDGAVLHVDDEGHLINTGKARGRQSSLKALVDKMEKTVTEAGKQTVFISHGDCLEDAEAVAQMVRERFGTQDIRINYVGPVIGAHSGPGTRALFYLGTQR